MSMRIYGGWTLNGFHVDDMIDENYDIVFRIENPWFCRLAGLRENEDGTLVTDCDSLKDEFTIRPAIVMFHEDEPFIPLYAQPLDPDFDLDEGVDFKQTQEFQNFVNYIKAFGHLDELTPGIIHWISEIHFSQQFRPLLELRVEPVDNEGRCVEGEVFYRGHVYSVYCGEDPQSFQGSAVWTIAKQLEEEAYGKERDMWFNIYMTFNDYNYCHAENAFYNNQLQSISSQKLHEHNVDFMYEVAKHHQTRDWYTHIQQKLAEEFPVFQPYMDEVRKRFHKEDPLNDEAFMPIPDDESMEELPFK